MSFSSKLARLFLAGAGDSVAQPELLFLPRPIHPTSRKLAFGTRVSLPTGELEDAIPNGSSYLHDRSRPTRSPWLGRHQADPRVPKKLVPVGTTLKEKQSCNLVLQ